MINDTFDFSDLITDEIYITQNQLFHNLRNKFTEFACTGDLSNFDKEFDKLFSKENGIAVSISQLTYNGNSIYHLPIIIRDRIQDLRNKYHNKFKYHISNHNPDKILDIFFQLYQDIYDITDKQFEKKKSPTLKELLANRKSWV